MLSQPDLLTCLYALVLAAVLRMGIHWALALDHDPSAEPGVVMIPITPLSRFLEWALMFAAAFAFIHGFQQYFNPSPNTTTDTHLYWIRDVLIGAVFALITAFTYNSYLWLDDDAMHYRRAVGRIRTIPWSKLDHYEIKEVATRNGHTFYYLFRSTDGETITIHRMIYDIDDLLEKIDAHKPVREEPYHPGY